MTDTPDMKNLVPRSGIKFAPPVKTKSTVYTTVTGLEWGGDMLRIIHEDGIVVWEYADEKTRETIINQLMKKDA